MKAFVPLILLLLLPFAAPARAATPAEISAEAMEGYRLFTRDSLPDDKGRGYEMMVAAAWEGDAKAANNVGWILQHGLYGEADPEGALRWYGRAVDQKLPAAALNYVDLVMSLPEASRGEFADSGRLASAAMLAGTALAMGRGLPYDYRKGEELILKAAFLGDESAALTVAQQLEMYPDSFSYLPVAEIAEQCDSFLPPGRRNLPSDPLPPGFADTLLTPQYWYSRTTRPTLP